jgi:uracil-DNA glycosylase
MSDIFLLGEAWGEEEERQGLPFVGTSGFILNGMLSQVGINRKDCYVSNVFNVRPKPKNDVKFLCGGKDEGIPGLPYLQKGKYVLARYAPELDRLFAEIKREQPNVIVALGATAAWALLLTSGIRKIRGATAPTHPLISARLGREYKVLPTYHPAAIAREWTNRPVGLADLDKARRESGFPEVVRPSREIWLEPTLDDLQLFEERYIINAPRLSVDIETSGDQITCIGFAPATDVAIVIPFHSKARGGNYWPTLGEEKRAWGYVRRWCQLRPTIFQNGLYDIHFLWRRYGIVVPQAVDDTMLLHHALQPEMEKGLGFMATLYTDEASWKFMRKKHETVKRED